MNKIIRSLLTLICFGCAAGGVGSPIVEHEKGEQSRVMGLAILELQDQPPGLHCTASFLTATVLLTSASCLQFETKRGSLGRAQSVETGEFLPIDTIWSLSTPSEPGDIGLVRLSQPPAVVSVFQIKDNQFRTSVATRFGGTGCESGVRSAYTTDVLLPPETRGVCPNGSGGVVFDIERRQIYAMHVGVHSNGDDQYTELPFYAQQIAQATADLLGAPTSNAEAAPTNSEDPCHSSSLYNDGICHQECALPDPDCAVSETPPCQSANDYLDGQCPENCHTDPDCLRQQATAINDPCEDQGLYNNGQCDSCPQVDPDCANGTSADFCEDQNLYNDGTCNRCPRPDPDCATNQPQEAPAEQSDDVCARLGAYGDGKCDSRCPRRDPDCNSPNNGNSTAGQNNQQETNQPQMESENNTNGSSGNDLCAALDWYNDGECDTVCANPDPDCTQATSANTGNAGNADNAGNAGNAGNAQQDAENQNNNANSNSSSQGSDLCELLDWYNDGECDTVCANPDPDC